MDSLDGILGTLVKFEWVADRMTTLATIQPRHIGRVVTFDLYESAVDAENYVSERVIGTLEGADSKQILVSGDWYPFTRVANLKSYRREIVKK